MEPKTFAFVSLGCPKNLVDSERMLGKLAQDGYALVPDADGADIVVVNTCGFIEPARQESLAVIREMLALKQQGRSAPSSSPAAWPSASRTTCCRKCRASTRSSASSAAKKSARSSTVPVASGASASSASLFRPAPVRAQEDTARLRITPRHYAYLKISEGCDRTLHLLRHPRHARQARHQADRGGRRAKPTNWPPTACAN